jgi:hypothetical protein
VHRKLAITGLLMVDVPKHHLRAFQEVFVWLFDFVV